MRAKAIEVKNLSELCTGAVVRFCYKQQYPSREDVLQHGLVGQTYVSSGGIVVVRELITPDQAPSTLQFHGKSDEFPYALADSPYTLDNYPIQLVPRTTVNGMIVSHSTDPRGKPSLVRTYDPRMILLQHHDNTTLVQALPALTERLEGASLTVDTDKKGESISVDTYVSGFSGVTRTGSASLVKDHAASTGYSPPQLKGDIVLFLAYERKDPDHVRTAILRAPITEKNYRYFEELVVF